MDPFPSFVDPVFVKPISLWARQVEEMLKTTAIIKHPSNVTLATTNIFKEKISFFVWARGTAPLQYQWFLDGKQIVGATGPLFETSIDLYPSGSAFTVQVTNTQGHSITSKPAFLHSGNTTSTPTSMVPVNAGSSIFSICYIMLSQLFSLFLLIFFQV